MIGLRQMQAAEFHTVARLYPTQVEAMIRWKCIDLSRIRIIASQSVILLDGPHCCKRLTGARTLLLSLGGSGGSLAGFVWHYSNFGSGDCHSVTDHCESVTSDY